MTQVELLRGDCLDIMPQMPDSCIDTIITDPPYGLNFMGKKWDYDVPTVNLWKECLRVLKPGGTALIFAGPRTQHRMAVNVEDAGFVLFDVIHYLYGSGFPKSTNIKKQLIKDGDYGYLEVYEKVEPDARRMGDKEGELPPTEPPTKHPMRFMWKVNIPQSIDGKEKQRKILQSEMQEQGISSNREEGAKSKVAGTQKSSLEGWCYIETNSRELSRCEVCQMLEIVFVDGKEGRICNATPVCNGETYWSVLKSNRGCPSYRPQSSKQQHIKPHAVSKQYYTQEIRSDVEEWGGYGTHLKPAFEPIICARKPNEGSYAENALKWGVAGLNIDGARIGSEVLGGGTMPDLKDVGRQSKEAIGINKMSFGQTANASRMEQPEYVGRFPANIIHDGLNGEEWSRYFYTAKASKSERNAGCEALEEKVVGMSNGAQIHGEGYDKGQGIGLNVVKPMKNPHPTVKPLALMEYLCKLTMTPTGGVVLDPFAGSGTTGVACRNTGRDCILIEREAEYWPIIEARIRS